ALQPDLVTLHKRRRTSMKLHRIFLALALVLVLALAACQPQAATPAAEEPAAEEPAAEEPAAEEPAAEDGPFRVAVVTPSTTNDLDFSQSINDALLAMQEERGGENCEFVVSENRFVVDDAAAAIRDYASQGYDLVIAHGSQYGTSLVEIAPDFPDLPFAWGT